jgi:ATP-binding cassette subfamily B protein
MALMHPLTRLLSYAGGYRRRIITAVWCSILNKLFDLAPPVLIGAAIDVVVERDDSFIADLGVTGLMPQLWALAGATVVIWALESVFEYAYGVLWRNLSQDLQHGMRLDAYQHVQGLDLAYFEEQRTGGLMAVLNDDINQLERFLDGGANDLIQVGTTVVAVGGAFLFISPGVFLLSFTPIPIILWGSFLFQRRIAPRYADVRERVGELNAQLANNLNGVATIKSFTAERFEVKRIGELSAAYKNSNERAIRLSSAFSPLIRMVIVFGFTATLVYGGALTETGGLAVGAYGVLVFLTQRLLWPLTRLGTTVDLYQRAMASTERVLDLLAVQKTIVSGPQRLPIGDVRGEVIFEEVCFSYPSDSDRRVVNGLSLTMRAGETTAIVGATGSGKTTLAKLLLRFYDVTSGRVLIDGRDVRTLDLDDLRAAIGLVSQDVFLFPGTVADNISYGSFDASRERIRKAAELAEAHDFIEALPNGYDSLVGERGQKLSGGQRQRISLARAILKDPPILILDEATSSVDNETEAAIQRSLARVSVDRTTIIIAHRLSTIRHAHRIVVLEDGQIHESGLHGELVQRGGIYAGLWSVQTGERV